MLLGNNRLIRRRVIVGLLLAASLTLLTLSFREGNGGVIGGIQRTVSERFGLSVEELCGDRRSQNIVYPRQVAMYLSRELTDSSLPKIGKEFGGRDHTTVIHATSKIARLIREDRSVYNLVQELTARVRQAR